MTAAELRTARAVRETAHRLLTLGIAGQLRHFTVHIEALPDVVERVATLTRATYPDVARIPYHSRWRHFGVGGVDRAAELDRRLAGADEAERLRVRCELAITSVLLDAGAGPAWSFREAESGLRFARSEGLAVASFHAFVGGAFGPLRADAAGLLCVTDASLGRAFQVDAANPLLGLAGRVALLRRLGEAVAEDPVFRAADGGLRLGGLADHLRACAEGGVLPATMILEAVLAHLGPIWPGRLTLDGVNLGDVWPHEAVGWVPLHKLSQWLSYSLCEPLEWAGVRVTGLDELTGLAEYRNGGLFLDGGVLCLRDPAAASARHAVGSELVVEWRGLTVALLDRTAEALRARLHLDAAQLPLAKVLEGGTWAAGRQIAAERRPGGGPPLTIDSDGTVF